MQQQGDAGKIRTEGMLEYYASVVEYSPSESKAAPWQQLVLALACEATSLDDCYRARSSACLLLRLAQCRRACAHGTTVDCALSFLLARHFCVNCGRCVCEKLTIRRPPHCVCKQGQRLPSPPSHLTQPRHSPPSASLTGSARPAGHNGLPMPPLMTGRSPPASSSIAREPAHHQHQQHQAVRASPRGHFRVGPASVDSDS